MSEKDVKEKLCEIYSDAAMSFEITCRSYCVDNEAEFIVNRMVEEGVTIQNKGKWILEYWSSGYRKCCHCSECGNRPKDIYELPNFCDECGAIMEIPEPREYEK